VSATLPVEFIVRLGRRVRVLDGRVLVGGSPTTVLSLAPRAVESIHNRRLTVTDAATSALANRLIDLGMAAPVPDLLPPASRRSRSSSRYAAGRHTCASCWRPSSTPAG
jgi:hypothetical protein